MPKDSIIDIKKIPSASSNVKSLDEIAHENKIKQLESVKDDEVLVRATFQIEVSEHEEYKMYLLKKKTSMRDHLLKFIRECLEEDKK